MVFKTKIKQGKEKEDDGGGLPCPMVTRERHGREADGDESTGVHALRQEPRQQHTEELETSYRTCRGPEAGVLGLAEEQQDGRRGWKRSPGRRCRLNVCVPQIHSC